MAYSKKNLGWGETGTGIVFRKDVRKIGNKQFSLVDVGRTKEEAHSLAKKRTKRTSVRKSGASWSGPQGESHYYDVFEEM